jgi:transcriptional regulator with XRE-family HTH domain
VQNWERIRLWRRGCKKQQVSARSVARDLGLAHNTVRNAVSGGTRMPERSLAERIAAVCDRPVEVVFPQLPPKESTAA